eukprot:2420738-Rhodomonas_salina.1
MLTSDDVANAIGASPRTARECPSCRAQAPFSGHVTPPRARSVQPKLVGAYSRVIGAVPGSSGSTAASWQPHMPRDYRTWHSTRVGHTVRQYWTWHDTHMGRYHHTLRQYRTAHSRGA